MLRNVNNKFNRLFMSIFMQIIRYLVLDPITELNIYNLYSKCIIKDQHLQKIG